jgi:hypothetical protein
MQINKIEIKATIPTRQYENIQPCIEITDIDNYQESLDKGLGIIKELIGKYSEHGNIKEKDVAVVGITKQSFNQDVQVVFEPIAHTYHYNGKPMTSATTYIQKFLQKFDKDKIAPATAKAWGVAEKDLLGLWDSNQKISSDIGTLVHNALEHYDKFKQLGRKISDKKSDDGNYALPKHPLLRTIIEGFQKVDKYEGKVIPEALLTDVDTMICGHADRIMILDEQKKVCRVQDYKVNVDSLEETKGGKISAPFNELPATKLSKYQLQMSIYANILEKHGWTVQGLDAFVYEDEWKHYELEVLDVLNK